MDWNINFRRVFLLAIPLVWLASGAMAKSAYSPRHSGLEPPGEPKKLDILPGNSPGRTPEGGMGYVDAYGNSLLDREKPKKPVRRRPSPGAYGGYGQSKYSRPLPDPDKTSENPLWNYR